MILVEMRVTRLALGAALGVKGCMGGPLKPELLQGRAHVHNYRPG